MITFAYSHFGVPPVRSPRRESLCYGQISGCRGANGKNRRNNRLILRWDQLSFWWFMLDRQEKSGQGVSFGTMETNFRGKLHECTPNHRFGLHLVNWTQKLDCIRLIERTNWIAAAAVTAAAAVRPPAVRYRSIDDSIPVSYTHLTLPTKA